MGGKDAWQGPGNITCIAAEICRLDGGYIAPLGLASKAASLRKNCSFNECVPWPKTDKVTLIGGELAEE